MHQLVILGNGFDRACGLKSGFDEFLMTYASPGSEMEAKDGPWLEILKPSGRKGVLWSDIEKAISCVLEPVHGGQSFIDWVMSPESSNSCPSCFDLNLRNVDIGSLRAIVQNGLNDDGRLLESSRERLYAYLFDELHKIERDFIRYLDCQQSFRYGRQAEMLFKELKDEGIQNLSCSASTSVLNFNYTTPLAECGDDLKVVSDCNIHGLLKDGDVIFGIDGFGCEDELVRPFTKTYRLLALGQDTAIFSAVQGQSFYRSIKVIKIFGHSLAEADYSYFQALFDRVNLYSSAVILVYYYSIYEDGRDPETKALRFRESACKRVADLVTRYGTTLNNADHGKNLMHKLLLEGRLAVKKIEVPSYFLS